jgi:hypothetical protein
MDRRFVFLEKKGFTEINSERDKLDRIIVGVDEASVLYTVERGKVLNGDRSTVSPPKDCPSL